MWWKLNKSGLLKNSIIIQRNGQNVKRLNVNRTLHQSVSLNIKKSLWCVRLYKSGDLVDGLGSCVDKVSCFISQPIVHRLNGYCLQLWLLINNFITELWTSLWTTLNQMSQNDKRRTLIVMHTSRTQGLFFLITLL